ncbi:RNA-binding protein [Salarchaeum japonicum]|uniref:RNA-binding protein n=1 Tax=Salarchaeum japonicum TaxID=555573 RepID=A0AAV3T140_9EURY|nr:RNA-binding protein [Salarchaeum japonicum]
MEISSRHHLRSDEVSRLNDNLADTLGVSFDADTYELVELADSEFDLILVDGDPLACYIDDEPFVTVRGANETDPETGTVTVDAGAISFVSGGADVMRPGIVDADDAISEGDLVVIVEETHGKALAVGRALVPGSEMTGDSGKVVDSIHHVGDDLYEFVP